MAMNGLLSEEARVFPATTPTNNPPSKPGPAVEAMAAGIPLVSSDGGALAEVVADGGLQVPAGDSDALAKTLERVLTDAALASALGNQGRQRVERHFCWSVCAQQMAAQYRACIEAC